MADSALKNASSAISTLATALSTYRDNVISKKIKKKSLIKNIADELIEDIGHAYPKLQLTEFAKIRKHLSVVKTSLNSIIDLMNSDTSYKETLTVFSGKFSERIDELELLLQRAIADAEDEDLAGSKHITNTRATFSRLKSKHQSKLRGRLRPGSVKFLQVPVFAQLNPQINKPKLLNELGIEHQTVGTEHNTRDIGMVFPEQYLLTFNREEAIETAKEANTEETKANTAAYAREKKQTKAKHRETLTKFAQMCGYESRDDIKEFVAEAMKLKPDEIEPSLNRMFTRAVRSRDLRKALKPELVAIIENIKELDGHVRHLDELMKPAKAVGRSRKRTVERTNAPLLDVVHQVLRDIKQKQGSDLKLITDSYIVNPESPKNIMFWVVPSSVYKNLSAFSSGDKMVIRWGLPWSLK